MIELNQMIGVVILFGCFSTLFIMTVFVGGWKEAALVWLGSIGFTALILLGVWLVVP